MFNTCLLGVILANLVLIPIKQCTDKKESSGYTLAIVKEIYKTGQYPLMTDELAKAIQGLCVKDTYDKRPLVCDEALRYLTVTGVYKAWE